MVQKQKIPQKYGKHSCSICRKYSTERTCTYCESCIKIHKKLITRGEK